MVFRPKFSTRKLGLAGYTDITVMQYLSRPELFKQNHWHTDVRLGLGWLSVFVAAGTALYGYKIEFEQSKTVVSIGLVV